MKVKQTYYNIHYILFNMEYSQIMGVKYHQYQSMGYKGCQLLGNRTPDLDF